MKLFICLLLSALAFAKAHPFNRVVGGIDTSPHEFPYQISIQYNGGHICGGSILNENFIVTAAHCAKPANQTKIIAGAHNLKKLNGNEQVRQVKQFINHEAYSNGVGPYDIALIELVEPLVFNRYVNAVSLPKEGEYPEGKAIVSGWGSTSTDFFPIFPDILQKAILPIHTEKECFKLWADSGVYDKSNVCAGELDGSNSVCSGDSGGPLVLKEKNTFTLVGVVSWGRIPCGARDRPGVFTRVSSYIDWIQKNMKH
uniref:CSON013639 protein n=1 Tax=Culicoides sonorensis TaxID=179676 RepID=A0A336LL72_CULSO